MHWLYVKRNIYIWFVSGLIVWKFITILEKMETIVICVKSEV